MHSSTLIAIAIHLCFHLANSASFCDILQPLSLLLKGSPLIDELALYDVVNTPGVAADLSHISSPAVSSQLPAPSSSWSPDSPHRRQPPCELSLGPTSAAAPAH